MKNNKKGFTLIELLAVIAILAILVVLAVPAILDLFTSSKKSAFITQAQSIYKAAEEQIITKQLETGSAPTLFYSAGTDAQKLSLSGTNTVRYCIVVSNAGKITMFAVSDGTYNYKDTSISDITKIEAKSAGTHTFSDDGKVITACSGSGENFVTLAKQ